MEQICYKVINFHTVNHIAQNQKLLHRFLGDNLHQYRKKIDLLAGDTSVVKN